LNIPNGLNYAINRMAWLKNQRRQKAPGQSTVVGHASKEAWVPQGIAGWELFVSHQL